MSKIVQLKKQNEDIYPRTLDKSVLVSGTTTLDEYLNGLNTIIDEDELVISKALNDLNARVSDTYTSSETDSLISGFFDGANYDSNTKKIYFTHSGVTKAQIDATDFIKDGMVDNVVVSGGNIVITFNTDAGKEDISIPLSSIFDPNLYYTSAQTDILLDEKQEVLIAGTGITISGNVISSTIEEPQSFLTEVTYSELVTLRDTSALTPGATYRITDYTTTTIQENTMSAENDFDVIVKALSNSEIDENARAIQHEGDTYFADSNLNAWEIKYCLDNDNSRFHWADSGNGKGVIYYMKDEYDNECYYDFKNIMFQRWAVSSITGDNVSQDLIDRLEGVFVYDSEDQPTCYSYTGETYTQGRITFGVDASTSAYYYTFTWIAENGLIQDFSIEGNRIPNDEAYIEGCYGNSIGKTNEFELYTSEHSEDSLAFVLNNIVFVSAYAYNGDEITYGTYSNHLGDSCYSNTFGNNANSNTFGNSVNLNTFGNSVISNTFGNSVNLNTFGNSVISNTFGNSVNLNTFGNDVQQNTFGNNVQQNTFGNSVVSNTFGNSVNLNTFGNYVRYIIVENGNSYITLSTSGTTSASAYLQNIKISQGVVNKYNSGSGRKTIVHPTVNDQFQTIYAKDSLGNIIGYNPADVQKVIAEELTDLDERLKSLEQSSVSYQ